jgi:NAD(P)H-flavin reductase/ferredoxin
LAATQTIVVNGRRCPARAGESLLDAGIVIPHDCATGQCGTCRVRLYDGSVDPQGSDMAGTVLACRARITGPAVFEFDEVPAPGKRRGSVAAIEPLSDDIVQVTIGLEKRLPYLPGQYVKLAFRGYPARDFSPTLRHDGSGEIDELVFHIRREPTGRVSGRLGAGIAPGSDVVVAGPYGHAYHRLGTDRLVLVASGVGWAPIWAIARASVLREPGRPLVVVAGARRPENLYMRPALKWLREHGATVMLTCSGAESSVDALIGRPTLHMPRLHAADTVYAAGSRGMVAAVAFLAQTAGATCYTDAFVAAPPEAGIAARLLGSFSALFNRRKAAETIG